MLVSEVRILSISRLNLIRTRIAQAMRLEGMAAGDGCASRHPSRRPAPLRVAVLLRMRSGEFKPRFYGLDRLARETEHQCDRPHQNETDGPACIEIEPAPRQEFEAEVAINQPGRASAGRDHRGGMDDRDQHGHTEIGIDQRPGCLMSLVEAVVPAEAEIDRHQHQPRAMRDGHAEGPKPQLRRSYPGQGAWMTPV